MRYSFIQGRSKVISSNGQERLNVLRYVEKPDKNYFICQKENESDYQYFIEMKSIKQLYKTNTIPTELRRELKRMEEGW